MVVPFAFVTVNAQGTKPIPVPTLSKVVSYPLYDKLAVKIVAGGVEAITTGPTTPLT